MAPWPSNHDEDDLGLDGKDEQTVQFKVTASELRSFVERYERLEEEKKAVADQQKEVMSEAKGRGYDVRVIKKLVAERKRDPQDMSEEEAILQLYREALGMAL